MREKKQHVWYNESEESSRRPITSASNWVLCNWEPSSVKHEHLTFNGWQTVLIESISLSLALPRSLYSTFKYLYITVHLVYVSASATAVFMANELKGVWHDSWLCMIKS